MPSWAAVPRTSPVKPSRSRRAISVSPRTRAGSPAGSGAISVRMRLRSCSAKCGVELPISWRTSSTVTGRCRRSGCSASAMVLLRSGVDGLDLHQRIYPRLHRSGDGGLVADDPRVVVDAAHGVIGVAGLDVEQVVLQRLGGDAG